MKRKLNKGHVIEGVVWELSGILVLYLLTLSFQVSFLYVSIRVLMYPLFRMLFTWKVTK